MLEYVPLCTTSVKVRTLYSENNFTVLYCAGVRTTLYNFKTVHYCHLVQDDLCSTYHFVLPGSTPLLYHLRYNCHLVHNDLSESRLSESRMFRNFRIPNRGNQISASVSKSQNSAARKSNCIWYKMTCRKVICRKVVCFEISEFRITEITFQRNQYKFRRSPRVPTRIKRVYGKTDMKISV